MSTTIIPSRIAETFARCKTDGRTAIMPFLTVGYPSLEGSEQNFLGLVNGGADLIEIGVPFSDPIAEGTTIQKTSQKALENGVRLRDCIALVHRLRDRGVTIPLLLMGYYNPILRYGIERFVTDSAEAGVDGFIVPDLPAEESGDLRQACEAQGRDLIFLVAPTSTDARLEAVGKRGSGFIYCISVKGVTGARDKISAELGAYLERVRAQTGRGLPLAVGFGISRPDHVAEVARHAGGAIVGAALIDYLDTLPEAEQPQGAANFVRYLRGEAALPAGV